MRGPFPVGVAVLTVTSGVLTAVSGLPLLNLPYGSIRGQNFMPITGLAITVLVVGFVIVGLAIVVAGVVFLALPRWRIVPASVTLVLSALSLIGNASTSVLVIPSIIGVFAGLLGILSKSEDVGRKKLTLSAEHWLSAFPFVLTGVGLWEFGSLFLGCGPPIGIGTGACDLLGAPFYVISTLGIAALLSVLALPLWKALHYFHGRLLHERSSQFNLTDGRVRALEEPKNRRGRTH